MDVNNNFDSFSES